MRSALLAFMLCGLSLATTLPSHEQTIDFQPERCRVFFSIVWQDAKAATSVAGGPEDGTWLPKDAAKKYPELCYSPTATDLRFAVRFNSHYTDQGTRTAAAPMTGTITDSNQNRSTLAGTVDTVPDTRFLRRPYISLGNLAHFEGGSELDLGHKFSVSASGYYILPWGPQQIFVRGKKSSSGSTKGGVSLTRDDGINLGLDYTLSRFVDLSAGYSHSAYSVLNTVSFGVELNLASWLRKHHGE